MQELRCKHPHPRKPGECNSLLKIEGFGTVECPRCRRPIHFDFEESGTEALTASIA